MVGNVVGQRMGSLKMLDARLVDVKPGSRRNGQAESKRDSKVVNCRFSV
jgi:hypothetical protein